MVDTIQTDPDTLDSLEKVGTPTEQLVLKIDQYYEESKIQRDALLNRWVEALRYRKGEQWKDRKKRIKRGKKWSEVVMNRVLPIIEQQVAIMTENNPTGVFLPENSDDAEFAKDLSQLTHWRAKRLNMRQKFIRGCTNGKLYGFQAMYVFWDDSITGRPDVNVRLLDPRELIIDPFLQTSNPEDGDYVGITRQVTLDYLKYRWPDQADELQAEFEHGQDEFTLTNDSTSLDEELGHAPSSNIYPSTKRSRPMANLVSIWHRDYSMKTELIPTPLELLKQQGKVVVDSIGQNVYAETGEIHSEMNAPMIMSRFLSRLRVSASVKSLSTLSAPMVVLPYFRGTHTNETGPASPRRAPVRLRNSGSVRMSLTRIGMPLSTTRPVMPSPKA